MRRVVTPIAYPGSGEYATTVLITLTCATPGARIHYTTDGTEPSRSGSLFEPYDVISAESGSDGDRG